MKKRLIFLAALCLSLSSCGIPGALARSAGNMVKSASNVLNATGR